MRIFEDIEEVSFVADIQDYYEQIEAGEFTYMERVAVEYEIVVSEDDYRKLIMDLLGDHELFAGISLSYNEDLDSWNRIWVHTEDNRGVLVNNQGLGYACCVAFLE